MTQLAANTASYGRPVSSATRLRSRCTSSSRPSHRSAGPTLTLGSGSSAHLLSSSSEFCVASANVFRYGLKVAADVGSATAFFSSYPTKAAAYGHLASGRGSG